MAAHPDAMIVVRTIQVDTPETVVTLPLWAWHLLAFVLPVATLAALVTGPHGLPGALLVFSLIPWSVMLDNRAGPSLSQPDASISPAPFNVMVLLLTVMQVCNVVLLGRQVAITGLDHGGTWVLAFTVGINSGYSAIVVAHELIHRSNPTLQSLGRLLLSTVCYEHFFTEHVRGHHARVGTPEDGATARYGESFRAFWKRTVKQQFVSAWRLEQKRLGDVDMKVWDARNLRNRNLHGILMALAWLVGLGLAFGPGAGVLFLFQAYWAVKLLEAVNYFEHWGLTRSGKKVQVVDSWDTDNWFTRFTLVGLSRHADHHAHASRPYQQLRHFDESPKLPRGYFGTALMGMFQNERFQEEMKARLAQRGIRP